MYKLTGLFTLILSLSTINSVASTENNNERKGLLSEIRLSDSNEEQNQAKAFTSEVLITKAENQAIDTLQKLIKKKAGTSEEADLLYRLAELYMRRAKSGRFFDLDGKFEKDLKNLGLRHQKTKEALNLAVKTYTQILNRFPKFSDTDYVLFNNAMALAQLNEKEKSQKNFLQLIAQYPKSPLIPDALLEVGELYYQQKQFQTALKHFKDIEAYPQSKAFPYGLYKAAWCYYNLRDNDAAIEQLVRVVKQNPAGDADHKKYNLRRESLRDLTLFVGEHVSAQQLFGFFDKITTPDEIGEIMLALAGLYESHSRHKEISVFSEQFIKKYPEHKDAPILFSKLIETNETLKNREQVISQLTEMASFCRSKNKTVECKNEFKKISLEISKKWWEIWLKNKTHTEFSSLTERSFENLLSMDSDEQPDSTSRFAFAELLFQQQKFERASVEYEKVSLQKTATDSQKHDSLYGALFSIEKQIEKKESDELVNRQKTLALRYLADFKTGEYFKPLSFKVGYIHYKQKKLDESLKYLEPLATEKNLAKDLVLKSQDMVLDIYNLRKDYVTLQSRAKSYRGVFSDAARTGALDKIKLEAAFAQVQVESEKLSVEDRISLLMKFVKENEKTDLGKQAHWQAVSIAYSNGSDVKGAELSLSYVENYPEDKKSIDALKDALKAYLDAGQIKTAVKIIDMLKKFEPEQAATRAETKCELLAMEDVKSSGMQCWNELIAASTGQKKIDYIKKILSRKSDKKNSEYDKLMATAIDLNIEPYATENLIKKANDLLAAGKTSEAFSFALRINSRPVDESARAGARLIQAKILAQEFKSQSVKARADKLALVLSMKTEKLDKAFTAYSSAIKMSKEPRIHIEALTGIDELYVHFIESIENLPMPEGLTPEDQSVLKAELSKLVVPFKDKAAANRQQIAGMNMNNVSNLKQTNWTELPVNVAPPVELKQPDPSKFKVFLPEELVKVDSSVTVKRAPESNRTKCDPELSNVENINACIVTANNEHAEKIANRFAESPAQRVWGLYYLSLVAEKRGQLDKAVWLSEKILSQNSDFYPAKYQSAKVQYNVESLNTSISGFEKLFDKKNNIAEVASVSAFKHFSQRDFSEANKDFSGLSIEQNYNYGMATMHIEAELNTTNINKALELAAKYEKIARKDAELEMMLARVNENNAHNIPSAIRHYENARSYTNKIEQKNWLTKKIEYLKNNTNKLSSNVGGEK